MVPKNRSSTALSLLHPVQLTEQVVCHAILIAWVSSALRMEKDESMYIGSIITYRLRGTSKLVGLLPDRRRVHHPKAVREYREQERRDKADVAGVQAATRRARSELRKKK